MYLEAPSGSGKTSLLSHLYKPCTATSKVLNIAALSSMELLDEATPPLLRVFTRIGEHVDGPNSLSELLKRGKAALEAILDLPLSTARDGLLTQLITAMDKAFEERSKRVRENLSQPSASASVLGSFIDAGGIVAQLLETLKFDTDELSSRVRKEVAAGTTYPDWSDKLWHGVGIRKRMAPHDDGNDHDNGEQDAEACGDGYEWPVGEAHDATHAARSLLAPAAQGRDREPVETSAAGTNAARNARDEAALRAQYPDHCAYHLFRHHLRGFQGCTFGDAGCSKGSHDYPEGLEEFARNSLEYFRA